MVSSAARLNRQACQLHPSLSLPWQAQFGEPSAALSNATILIPTNAAMEGAPAEVRALFSNPGATASLLAYQTLEGVYKAADFKDGQRLPTFARGAQVGGRQQAAGWEAWENAAAQAWHVRWNPTAVACSLSFPKRIGMASCNMRRLSEG